MCTSIIEIARAEGMAKRGDTWFPLSQAVVAYDHARHAPLGDVITLDFFNTDLDAGARAGIELTLETAKLPDSEELTNDAVAAYEPDLHSAALKALALNCATLAQAREIAAAWALGKSL